MRKLPGAVVVFFMLTAALCGCTSGSAGKAAKLPERYIKTDIYGVTLTDGFYLWRSVLSAEEQTLYDQICAGALALEPDIIPAAVVTADRMPAVLEAVRYDNPELFWLDNALEYTYDVNDVVVAVELWFNPEVNVLPEYQAAFEESGSEAVLAAAELQSGEAKVRFIHDYLIKVNDYVRDAELDQTAYGAVVNGEALCMGFALAFEYYMQRLGIPCAVVSGEANGGPHVWNLVYLDGVYYNIDVTWDRLTSSERLVSYKYYLLPDRDMSYHVRETPSDLFPAADGSKL